MDRRILYGVVAFAVLCAILLYNVYCTVRKRRRRKAHDEARRRYRAEHNLPESSQKHGAHAAPRGGASRRASRSGRVAVSDAIETMSAPSRGTGSLFVRIVPDDAAGPAIAGSAADLAVYRHGPMARDAVSIEAHYRLSTVPGDVLVVKDAVISDAHGELTVDQLVVCPHGVFLFEIYPLDGTVFAPDRLPFWLVAPTRDMPDPDAARIVLDAIATRGVSEASPVAIPSGAWPGLRHGVIVENPRVNDMLLADAAASFLGVSPSVCHCAVVFPATATIRADCDMDVLTTRQIVHWVASHDGDAIAEADRERLARIIEEGRNAVRAQ
ncbi:nuclease-related domain-containing protein [Pseudoscardovia radai]|uniref:nuclease-related domain-containing protein n=1 Tax=Pseudoscardovia radai TaxID=987066 RepID=UPI0039932054